MGSTTNKFKLHLAEKFLYSFSTDNIWLFVGKPDAWVPVSFEPDTFSDTALIDIENWDDIMSVQRLSDVSFVIPFNEITSGAVFTEYDDNSNIFDSASSDKFFGVSNDSGTYRVYKCISNNNGAIVSNVPITVQSAVIKSANDGYVWKYMYTISTSEWGKYQTEDSNTIGGWVPVKRINIDDSSGQFDTVMKNAIDGEIQHITTAGSTTFSNVTNSYFASRIGYNVWINRQKTGAGYGSGFIATIAQHSNSHYYINITNGGSGYRKISTIETETGSVYTDASAYLRPILSPIGGHGWDAVNELGGFRVMISAELDSSMTDFILENDFRKIGLLVNPYKNSSTFDYIQTISTTDTYISGEKYTSAVNARQLVKIKFSIGSWGDNDTAMEASLDEEFTQRSDSTSTDNTLRLIEVESDNQTAHFLITAGELDTTLDNDDTTLTYPTLRGTVNSVTDTDLDILNSAVSNVTKEKLKKYSGNIIYVDNIQTVTRASATQKVKLVIEF